jgi:hypothetical protein
MEKVSPKIIYKIIDRKTGDTQSSYQRGNYHKFEFESAYSARLSNCHGVYTDKEQFKIVKYKVTYEVIDEDCDIEEELKKHYERDLERIAKQ